MRGSCLAAILLTAVAGCAKPENSPADVWEVARGAFAESRWDRLFTVLPPSTQAYFLDQIASFELALRQGAEATAQESGQPVEVVIDELLTEQVGLTAVEWSGLPVEGRFARFFSAAGGELELARVGLNVGQLGRSHIESVDQRDGTAVVTVNDGQFHRDELTFVLVDGRWRLDLGYE